MAFGQVRKAPAVLPQPLCAVGVVGIEVGVGTLVFGEEEVRALVEVLRVVDEAAPQTGEAIGVLGLEFGGGAADQA